MQSPNQMEYRYLGSTGLQVSVLSFGHMIAEDTPEFQQTFDTMIQTCLNNGINYFDTAEAYSDGVMETVLGRALKTANLPRENFVISTKFFWKGLSARTPSAVNKVGLSTKHILEAASNSLKRLQLDNVDIIFCHRNDAYTSVEETCRAMNQLIEGNKAYYWGTSEWSAGEISEAFAICDRLGLIKPVVDQCQYNMLVRHRFEVEYGQLFDKYKYGNTIWSPLCQGVLTGKYNQGFPEDSRWNLWPVSRRIMEPFLNENERPNTVRKLQELQLVADELNCSLPQLSIAWILRNKDVSTVLLGASRPEQIEANVKSLQVYNEKWNPELNERIEKILNNRPEQYINQKTYQRFEPRI